MPGILSRAPLAKGMSSLETRLCRPFVPLSLGCRSLVASKDFPNIHSGYRSLIRYTSCKYFLPFGDLFNVLYGILGSTNGFIWMESNLSIPFFFFGVVAHTLVPGTKFYINFSSGSWGTDHIEQTQIPNLSQSQTCPFFFFPNRWIGGQIPGVTIFDLPFQELCF